MAEHVGTLAPAPAPPKLVAIFGPKRGLRIDVDVDVTVGRSSSAELQLIDGKVSREHCRFRRREGRVWLEDLSSQNGTFINGERVTEPRALARGDEIAIGDSLLLFDPDVAVLAARFGEATLVVSGASDTGDAHVASPTPTALTVAGRAIAGADAETATRILVDAVAAGLHADRVQLLAGASADQVRVLGGVGRQGDTAPVLDGGLVARSLHERRAVLGGARAAELTVRSGRTAVVARPGATLLVPVVVGEHVRGFLHLTRAQASTFSPDDIAAAEAFAALAAVHGLGGAFDRPRVVEPDGEPVGTSPAFKRVLTIARAAAGVGSTVLVTGETGTGKEVIARLVHRSSARADRSFVAVNCGAIAESLAESELFGHERGAFTGALATRIGCLEAADGGTLFLDEIGELSLPLQVKLLRVLQERVLFRVGSAVPRPIDVRVIAATHRKLEDEVAAGRFREDLLFRLDVIRVHIPPLRERREDVGPLAAALLGRIARTLGRRDPGLAPDALAALERASWRGNARELGNALERALVLRTPGAHGPLAADELELAVPDATSAPASGSLGDKVAALERTEIVKALEAARGVKSRAARALGISRPTLDKKLEDLGIDSWSPQ